MWLRTYDDKGKKIIVQVNAVEEVLAYADDLMVVVASDSRTVLEEKGKHICKAISDWCATAKIKISAPKTGPLFKSKYGWGSSTEIFCIDG